MRLYNYFKNIILENADKDEIVQSIQNKNTALIYYQGDTVTNTGYREIEPYVYGVNKNNNEVVRAYQVTGVSDTDRAGWKMFRVDRILNYEVTDNTFEEARPGFNPLGDQQMSRIFQIATFQNNY